MPLALIVQKLLLTSLFSSEAIGKHTSGSFSKLFFIKSSVSVSPSSSDSLVIILIVSIHNALILSVFIGSFVKLLLKIKLISLCQLSS